MRLLQQWRARLRAPIAASRQRMQNAAVAHELTDSYLADAVRVFHTYKRLGESAMAQTPDEALTIALDAEANSIAIIVKHMAGNMRSRWTDFLTTDGEKPSRNRDTEFELPAASRAELTAQWEAGWKCVFDALGPLGCRPGAHRPDSQPTPFRDAGYQSPVGTLFLPRGPDRISSQAFRQRALDVVVDATTEAVNSRLSARCAPPIAGFPHLRCASC
jgi:hypothetical protein